MQHLAIRVVRGLEVDAERMRANLELTHGALFSQRVLLALVESGSDRDSAYRVAQELAQQARATPTPLRELVATRPDVALFREAARGSDGRLERAKAADLQPKRSSADR